MYASCWHNQWYVKTYSNALETALPNSSSNTPAVIVQPVCTKKVVKKKNCVSDAKTENQPTKILVTNVYLCR